MAAYLNRTISLVTGNGTSASVAGGQHVSSSTNALTDPSTRQLHHHSAGSGAADNSPLQIFVKAKKRINDIFGEIEEYVVETAHFISGKCQKLISKIFSNSKFSQNGLLSIARHF